MRWHIGRSGVSWHYEYLKTNCPWKVLSSRKKEREKKKGLSTVENFFKTGWEENNLNNTPLFIKKWGSSFELKLQI